MSDLRSSTSNPPDDPANAVSERLVVAMRALAEGEDAAIRMDIPRRVDDAVRAAARTRLAGVRQATVRRSAERWTLRRAAACGAMAASLALAAVLAMPRVRAGDINHDGAVDILDAMRLARGIEQDNAVGSGSLRGGRDLNRDDVIDQLDVQWIALHAVRLPEEAG